MGRYAVIGTMPVKVSIYVDADNKADALIAAGDKFDRLIELLPSDGLGGKLIGINEGDDSEITAIPGATPDLDIAICLSI